MATRSDRRIDRLLVTLTPRERALLVLRAWKEGREPAAHLLHSRSDGEAFEYNRILDLLRVASEELTQYLVVIHLLVGQLQMKLCWYLTILLWGLAHDDERAEELRVLVLKGLTDGIAQRWRELGALEVALAEIADEVDGEDVLHPAARSCLVETREQLHELHDEVTTRGGDCELGDPSDEDVEAVRALIKKATRS